MEFFKRFFNFGNNPQLNKENDLFGITGLPKDVEEDLFSRAKESGQHFIFDGEQNPNDFHFHIDHFHHDRDDGIFGAFDEITKRMFNEFFTVPFSGYPGQHPPLEYKDRSEEESLRDKFLQDNNKNKHSTDRNKGSLRNRILQDNDKNSHCQHHHHHHPFHSFFHPFRQHIDHNDHTSQEDSDFDSDLKNGRISMDDILRSSDKRRMEDQDQTKESANSMRVVPFFNFPPHHHGSSVISKFSSSTSTRVNPDGSTETIKRRTDHDGNEEVVTSRQIGDQTHTVITKRNKSGEEERVENFVNMDENSLNDFNEKWKGNRGHGDARSNALKPPDDDFSLSSRWRKPKL